MDGFSKDVFSKLKMSQRKELTLKAGDVVSFIFDEFEKGAMDVLREQKSAGTPSTSKMTPGFGPTSEKEESHQRDVMVDYQCVYEAHIEVLRRSFRETQLDNQKMLEDLRLDNQAARACNQETQEVIREFVTQRTESYSQQQYDPP